VSIFIGKNGNLVCIYHKYGQKTRVKVVINVLIECWKPNQSEKTCVLQFWPSGN